MSRGLPGQCLSSLQRTRQSRSSCKFLSSSIPGAQRSQRSFATSQFKEGSEDISYSSRYDEDVEDSPPPRWRTTPARMKAPFRSKPPPLKPSYFPVNEDPKVLDKVYVEVLGNNGDQVLTEEVKWLAVTHKSFDQGRRGYNDRLAFLGKRIVDLQASIAILTTGSKQSSASPQADLYGRKPFQHPALENLGRLTERSKFQVLDPARISMLALRYGLDNVVRWQPKNIRNLKGSGQPLVLTQALYAIFGAVAFQKGGLVANKLVQERLLEKMGLRQQY